MHQGYKRRSFLAGSGAMALGGAGLGGVAVRGDTAKSRAQNGTAYRIAVVGAVHGSYISVQGDTRVLRLECVPSGWRAAVGDKVAVGPSPDADGVTAEQLVHWVEYTGSLADVVPGQRLGSPAGPLVTTFTSIEPSLAARRGSSDWTARRRLNVALTDHVSGSAQHMRVLSVREA